MKLFTWANIITLLNLLCGCIACILVITNAPLHFVFYFLMGSLICDFLDGFVARITNTQGELGAQLDSLADMVSFGLLPGLLLFNYIDKLTLPKHLFVDNLSFQFLSLIGLLVTLFSALRLAKFNIDTEQSTYFKGLNTPTNTLAIFSVVWMAPTNVWILIAIIGLSCYLLISNIPMFSLKINKITWKKDFYRILFIIISLIAFSIYGISALAFIILGYILVSILFKNKFV